MAKPKLKKINTFFICSLALFVTVNAVGETLFTTICAAAPSAACQGYEHTRPCHRGSDNAVISDYPPGTYPCPCKLDSGGAFPGTGPKSVPRNDNNFDDELLAGPRQNDPNWTNLVGMAFTDNTKELFVITKAVC
jgi:hypothetical protein